MKKNYNLKKTISMKKFISEFGENFSQHMKKRLLELEVRSVLTRKENEYRLDLKHVEHTKYPCNLGFEGDDTTEKEYAYGQFVVVDGTLYFSEKCEENEKVMESPIVDTIFNSLSSKGIIFDLDIRSKVIDDNNIDYLIDTLLTEFPKVSQKYLDIVKGMVYRAEK